MLLTDGTFDELQTPSDICESSIYKNLVLYSQTNQFFANFPGKNARVGFLQEDNMLNDSRRGHARFAASDCAWQNGACLCIPREDLRDASMGYSQLPRDFTGPDSLVRQLDYSDAFLQLQGLSIHEESSQLIDVTNCRIDSSR